MANANADSPDADATAASDANTSADTAAAAAPASPAHAAADAASATAATNPTPDRRLIEDWLPINEISVEAVREGGALAGHPPVNQLHVWWARRPLVVSRAAVAGALLRADADKDQFIRAIGSTKTVVAERRRMDEIKASGKWSNVKFSNRRAFTHNPTPAERRWFQDSLAAADPVTLDVTAGGGSIPFEAGRLGVRTIANELNPVAALLLRATCQWPQAHGSALLSEYKTASARFLARVRQLIADNNVYPPEPGNAESAGPDASGPGASDAAQNICSNAEKSRMVRLNKYDQTYLFSRTIACPDCGGVIPLSPNWRLDGAGKGVRIVPDAAAGVCDFVIVDTASEQSRGTVARGRAVCPYPGCGATTERGYIAAEAQAGRLGHQLYCVIVKNQWQRLQNGEWRSVRRPKDAANTPNREFRRARPEDDNAAHIAALLAANRAQWDAADILPNEPVPEVGDKTDTPHQYGMPTWREMFSPRQLLVHGYCVQAFRELVDEDRTDGTLTPLREIAYAYIGIAFDKVINRNCMRSVWDPGTNKVAHSFSQHDFGMKWSYAEMPIAILSLGLEWALSEMGECIAKLAEMSGHQLAVGDGGGALLSSDDSGAATSGFAPPSAVVCGDARMLDIDDDSVDAVVFDPPYHNNVNYAELSDFFYVWLKRTAGYALGGDLFAEHLTDKVNEAIASPARFKARADAMNNAPLRPANTGNAGKSRNAGRITAANLATEDYQSKMDEIFRECHRVLKKDGGVMVVMFTHKSNDAWNAMTIGLIEAGFNITRTWPVKTEAESSLHIRDKAAARSTILLVCRPRADGGPYPKPWPQVAAGIADKVREDVARLQEYNLSPVDIYLAAFGPALQVISENWGTKREIANLDRPEDPFGVTPMDALEVARAEVVSFRARQITGGRERSLSDPMTRFYVLAQDGAGGATMPFDEANLFARAVGVDLDSDDAKRVLAVKSGRATLKSASERWTERVISAERPAVTPLDQVHTAIAITERETAAAAKNWLEFHAHRWQDEEFRTAFDAMMRVRKPGHPDEMGAKALDALLYEPLRPHQTQFPDADGGGDDASAPAQAPLGGAADSNPDGA